MNKKICLLPGDGIGPEILAEGRKVLEAVGAKTACSFPSSRVPACSAPKLPATALISSLSVSSPATSTLVNPAALR